MAKKATKKKNGVQFEGVSFNKGIINSYKTEAEFLTAMDSKENAHVFANDEARTQKLQQLYTIVHSKVKEPEPEGPITTADILEVADTSAKKAPAKK
jgi:hypothetical protein